MTPLQQVAFANPCLLACETGDLKFGRKTRFGSVLVTINRGYE